MSISNPYISIVVPCFNEQDRIVPTIEEMAAQLPSVLSNRPFEIIVVDDGSTDNTSKTVETLRMRFEMVRLVSYQPNRGKGAAVRAGCAESHGAAVLFADADGSTPIAELKRLLPVWEQQQAEIVIGSRAMNDAAVSLETRPHRKLLGRLFHTVVDQLVLPGLRDTQCGFKLLDRRVVTELMPTLEVNHFGFDIELLFKARMSGFRINEVAISWVHKPGSKVHLLRDSFQMLGLVLKLWAGQLLPMCKSTRAGMN